jgi:hypothetical protein
MSQFPTGSGTFNDPYGDSLVNQPKTSGLAITAIICSAIFFCPVTTLAGIVLGIAAIFSIGNNPMKKGKGLAIAAILLGIIFTIGQAIGLKYAVDFFGGYVTFTMRGPDEALKKGFGGDVAGFQSAFAGVGASLPAADATAFLNELESRYGTFVSAAFDERSGQQPQSQAGNPAVPFPYVLTFTNKTVNAEVELVFADKTSGAMLKKFGYIIVFDPDLGDLAYPASATAQPARTRGGRPVTPPASLPSTTQPANGDGG